MYFLSLLLGFKLYFNAYPHVIQKILHLKDIQKVLLLSVRMDNESQ